MNKYLPFLGILLIPLLVSAQLTGTETLISRAGDIVKLLTGVVAAIALLVFFWGIVKYIFAQGNEQAEADGKKIMVWGLVALFVMLSVLGIIAFMQRELGLPVTVDEGVRTRPLSDGCGPRSQGYAVECDNQFGDFGPI